jgi:hypothetical protein
MYRFPRARRRARLFPQVIKSFLVEKLWILKLPCGINIYSDLNGAALEKQQSGDSGEVAVGR